MISYSNHRKRIRSIRPLNELTKNINFSDNLSRSVSVLGNAGVLSSLLARYSVIEEEDIVRGHDLVAKLPLVVRLRIGLGRAQYLSTGRPLLDGDQPVGDLDIFWWVFKANLEVQTAVS